MNKKLKKIIWLQFGALIDMLENAIIECPEKSGVTEEKARSSGI